MAKKTVKRKHTKAAKAKRPLKARKTRAKASRVLSVAFAQKPLAALQNSFGSLVNCFK